MKRPRTAGGVKSKTSTRYRAVLDKFEAFCQDNQVRYWNEITRLVFGKYVQRLEDDDYAIATIDLELTTLKQVHKHLIDENHLPSSTAFKYSLKLQSNGTTTYCYTDAEVAAILKHCDNDELRWLHAIIVGLCHTGTRINELADLRWSDLTPELDDHSQRRNSCCDQAPRSPNHKVWAESIIPGSSRSENCSSIITQRQGWSSVSWPQRWEGQTGYHT